MATIKCAVCDFGIHYHDEPNNTEFILFPISFWKSLQNDDNKKCKKKYKLQADALEIEYPDSYRKLWRCPSCNALILFEQHSPNVEKIFVRDNDHRGAKCNNLEYVAFSDVTWDCITESDTNIDELSKKYPGEFYVVSCFDYFYVFSDEKLTHLISTYRYDSAITTKVKNDISI